MARGACRVRVDDSEEWAVEFEAKKKTGSLTKNNETHGKTNAKRATVLRTQIKKPKVLNGRCRRHPAVLIAGRSVKTVS